MGNAPRINENIVLDMVELAYQSADREAWVQTLVSRLRVLFPSALGEATALTPREQALFTKLAVHVGAGFGPLHTIATDDAEAILTPNGKRLQADADAQASRDEVDDGRRRQPFARKNADDPEKALEVWRGLITGRWSLVDHFDTDGKRFLLAMKNHPRVDRRGELTQHELQVCALAAMGHADKEIASMLGLSRSAVTSTLHRARRKLGVRSRVELAQVWRADELPRSIAI